MGYNIDIIKQSAGLAVDPVTADHFAYLFNFMAVGWVQTLWRPDLKINIYVDGMGRNFMSVPRSTRGLTSEVPLL